MFRKTMIMLTAAALGFSGAVVAGDIYLSFSGAVLAGDIYKWTDEDGNVHYEDRPTGHQVELVAVSSNTDNVAVQAGIDARRARTTARADARSTRDDEAQTAVDKKMESDQRTAKCQESRARMQSYLQARRLYNQDESGERVYLDEDQIMKARSRAQDEIQKYCD
jgi:hypothetical protein